MRKHNDKKVIQGYNNRARYYDFRFEGIKGELLDYFQKCALQELLKSQNISKDAKILEVGCGSGRFLESLEWNGYKNLYGIDSSTEMINIASKRTNNVSLQVANAYKLPFENNKFDFVFSVHVLMHLDNPSKMIHEMKRVTKQNGYIIIDINDKNSPFNVFVRLYRIFQKKKKHFPQMYSKTQISNMLLRNILVYAPTYFIPLNIPKKKEYLFKWYLNFAEKVTKTLNKTKLSTLSTQKFLLFQI